MQKKYIEAKYIEYGYGIIYDDFDPKEIEVYSIDGPTWGNEEPRRGEQLGIIMEMEVDPIVPILGGYIKY